MIPPAFIHDLLARADIVEIVGRYVALKKAGVNHKGLCPFHGEKTPSFTVSPTRQTYHCFGCGVHGNAIGFLMEHGGVGFVDAVRDLAQQLGMSVPDDDSTPAERERAAQLKARQGTLTETLARAAAHYRRQLRATPRAVEYLKGRGLTGDVAARFGLGYAPEGWRPLASAFPHYDDPLLEESGLVIASGDAEDEAARKRYDRFRDRVMFPIRSVQGEVIGFGGRVLGAGEPKYLNSPETPVFSKGRELYGLYEGRAALRQRGYALVVEGYMDVVALAQSGFGNAVATLGTACTAEHVQKLFRFTDSVVFSFDGDAAGRRAAGRALEAALPHATDTRTVRFLFLPAEHDPDSYVREFGAEAFERCVEQAVPLSRQLIEHCRDGGDLATPEGRARFLTAARPLWTALPDGLLKRQVAAELAKTGQMELTELLALWHAPSTPAPGAVAGAGRGAHRTGGHPPARSGPQAERRARLRNAPAGNADHALRILLLHSDWWDHLAQDDHELLHALPDPHGALCRWLERELMDHGARPWSALAEALQASEHAAFAARLVPPDTLDDELDLAQLRQVIDRLWIVQLKAEETELIAAAAHDPESLARYRQVHARRRQLESGSAAG